MATADSEATPPSPPADVTSDAVAEAAPDGPKTPAMPGFVSKEAVAQAIFPASLLEGYKLRLAYDLGSVRLAVVAAAASRSPQPLSLVRSNPPASSPRPDFERAFAGQSFEGTSHPLEFLGYDLVQVSSHGVDPGPSGDLPWVRFGWLRDDPEAGLERGSGSAHWIQCQEDAIVLVTGEGDESYALDAARSFVLRPGLCPAASDLSR
jgi:hypothetical protein